DNLTKRYDDHLVFEGLTYTFSPGCVALCEEDNTGKSSLLGIVAGVITPDTGDVWIEGYSMIHSPRHAKTRVTYIPDNCLTSPTQTGRKLLDQIAAEKHAEVDDIALDLAYRLGLEPHLDKRFEQMSTGTRR